MTTLDDCGAVDLLNGIKVVVPCIATVTMGTVSGSLGASWHRHTKHTRTCKDEVDAWHLLCELLVVGQPHVSERNDDSCPSMAQFSRNFTPFLYKFHVAATT